MTELYAKLQRFTSREQFKTTVAKVVFKLEENVSINWGDIFHE